MPEISYQPDGKVVQAFMRSDTFVRGLRGPVGSGKTVACCIELFRRAYQQPVAEDGKRHFRAVVVRNTQPELKTTTIKTWLDWFPEVHWGRFYWQPPFTHKIQVGDLDMEVIFLALDSEEDVKKLYSLEVTMAWVNEARFVPKAVIDTLTERVGRFPAVKDGGAVFSGIIMDTNAMDPDHWWPIIAGDVPLPDDIPEEEAVMLQKPNNWEFFNQPAALIEIKNEQGLTAAWKDNPKAENSKYLPKDYYMRQTQGKLRSHILRNVCNQLVVVKEGKTVFPSFSESAHISESEIQVIPNMAVYVGMDFGLTPAAIIGQTIRGRWLLQHELVATNMGAKQFAQQLKLLLARYYGFGQSNYIMELRAYGDPAGDQRAQTDEVTPFQILRAAGLPFTPAPSNDFILRTEAVEGVMRRMVEGKPALQIDPKCRHLIKALAGGYHYPKIHASGAEVRYADRPSKNASSHIADATQYLFLGAGEGSKVLMGDNFSQIMKPIRAKSRWSPFERLKARY